MILLVVKLLVGVFILLINVKMPTIVGILTFMSWIKFMLSCVEHEKSFITLGTDRLIGLITQRFINPCHAEYFMFYIPS